MGLEQIFPNWHKALRNALVIAAIAFASTFPTKMPSSFADFWPAISGFVIALIIEFVNAYRHTPVKKTSGNTVKTFFF